MKKIISLLLVTALFMSMTVTAFAAENQTVISMEIDESMESYELVIPATVSIDPAVKTGKVELKIQKINLIWNKGINLYVKAQNSPEESESNASGTISSYLIDTTDTSKKIAYKMVLGTGVVYSSSEPGYNSQQGVLTNHYRYDEGIRSWVTTSEEINLTVTGDYPGSGTYTDTLTFTVELYQ